MQSSFSLISGDGKKGYLLWILKVLLSFFLITERSSNEVKYGCLQYMTCVVAQDETDNEEGFICLK